MGHIKEEILYNKVVRCFIQIKGNVILDHLNF